MRFLRRSLVGLFLLAATLGLVAVAVWQVGSAIEARLAEEPRSFPAREQVLSVNVVPYERRTVTPVLTAFGELRSRRTLDVRAAASGTVVETAEAFVDGGTVTAGDVLLRIDPAEAEAALARAETDLLDAEAGVRDAERGLDLAQDELDAAVAQLELRQVALDRARDLLDRGVGTAASVEAAELAVSSAEQALLSRRQSLAQAETRLDQARTALARTRITVDDARRALDQTVIRAEFSGVLDAVNVGLGGRVSAGEVVARIVDPDALEAAFRVSTSQYAQLIRDGGQPTGAPVVVSLDVGGIDIVTTGRVTRESPSVGEGLTGRQLFATLDEAAGFRPGDFVTVRVEEAPLDGVAMLPATAYGGDGAILVVGEDDRLGAVPAERLRTQGDEIIVRADIADGTLVVAERSPLLGRGIRVKPIGAAVPPASSAAPEGDGEMIALDPERRAALVAAVEGNSRIPAEAKSRLLATLQQDEVPAEVVARIESRMGG